MQKSMLDRELLNAHRNNIIKNLQFKREPIVLYDDDALDFVRINVPDFKNKSDKKIRKRVNGYFHYKNLPPKYVNTGVVCIFKEKIGTLAHELCHAKQFQDNNKWMESRKYMKLFYKLGYAFYPTEREAFTYAENYLKAYKLDELVSYKKHTQKIINKNVCQWRSTLYLFLVVLVILNKMLL